MNQKVRSTKAPSIHTTMVMSDVGKVCAAAASSAACWSGVSVV